MKRVIFFSTGVATSTFGGGGGTKVFCSQALKVANAIVTSVMREAVTNFCAREGFIQVPHSFSKSRRFKSIQQGLFRRTSHSNNPLAVEPETENDGSRESCSASKSRVRDSVEAAAPAKAKKGLLKMFDTLKRDAALCALTAALMLAIATPSFAQPTEAQKEAVKSACRSDYMAHCSSVTPGGEAALQCLAKNMSSLSSGCASAVKAIEASAEPKSEPAKSEAAPAAAPKTESTAAKPAAEPKAAPSTAANKPTDAQVAAIRSACRSDYPKVCAGVPTGGAPALECLEKNKARVSAGCGKALAAVGGAAAPAGGAAPAAGGAAPATAPAVIVLRPMRPREELFVMRSACGADIRTLCAGVAPGGGRIMQCIANRAADLSPACRDVLTPFMAR